MEEAKLIDIKDVLDYAVYLYIYFESK